MEKNEAIHQKLDKLLALSKDVFTIDEAALYTGLSKQYLYKLTHRRKIPFSKPNNKIVYFCKKELNEWLLRNPQKTRKQIEAKASDYIHLKSKK